MQRLKVAYLFVCLSGRFCSHPFSSLDECALYSCKNLGRYCVPRSRIEKMRSRVLAQAYLIRPTWFCNRSPKESVLSGKLELVFLFLILRRASMNLSIGILHALLPGSCEVEQNFYRKCIPLFFCPDKCNGCTDESSNATETSQTPIPGDATSDGEHHMTENHTHDGLVRSKC